MSIRARRDLPGSAGDFTLVNGEQYYRISAYHRMRPFFMSIASDTDLWMFITSGGGLTAGRVDPDGSLFPYETVDRLHDGHHHTGPVTLIRVERTDGPAALWEPFSDRSSESYRIERNLYKNIIGNRLIFEEINQDLELVFRYRWSGSDEFGLVRTATLESRRCDAVAVSVLDGLRNILPYGAPLALYQQSSCLVDAYKRSDGDPDTGLGIFSLTAKIIDRAEAAEELRANIAWCQGLRDCAVCLSGDAIAAFRRGESPPGEALLTGRRGNYLVVAAIELQPKSSAKWHLVADVGRSHVQIAAVHARLRQDGDLDRAIEDSLEAASENLLRNVGSADGLQLTGHPETTAHHFASVLFNNMRGGVLARNYAFPASDFHDFLRTRNREVADRHRVLLESLTPELSVSDLRRASAGTGAADFQRLAYEYLPIYFGRRHGDPSRPWNRFTIRNRNPDGSRALRYEGNWRDIFQNWEALSLSFPGILPNIIAKFVNASTVDGFNPYRITRDGIDWELVDPDDPWSHIGYWGDHQIIYLLKLLEALQRFAPGTLEDLLRQEIFCYADVPYRLKSYAAMLGDPHSTIAFDAERAAEIGARVASKGTDGKLLCARDGSVYHVTLLEKLLVPALSKLSNFVADGGIWMNTQRPEWNDANNALVGNGVSVVTLCHLRRYLHFLAVLLGGAGDGTVSISTEVAAWFGRLQSILSRLACLPGPAKSHDRDRKQLLDDLGKAFEDYRSQVYAHGFSGRGQLSVPDIAGFCRGALAHLDHAISANRREDGLYHSYNLLEQTGNGSEIAIRPLQEMLEGQVAALDSGLVEPAEAVGLLSRLFESNLYRSSERSFLLYPERELPGFMARNVVPGERARAVPLLRKLVEVGETSILARDAQGTLRFHGDFRNAADLAAALDRLAERGKWAGRVAGDREAVLQVFEDVFRHRAFTGRSGTMYGYEGLGCIYWHMVSKLLLAVQDIALRAAREGQPAPVRDSLARLYYRIRAGLGFEKSAAEFGAFPTDPYSHTPPSGGAQQPGMTGQVKEQVIARFGELGILIDEGIVAFRPALLRPREFRQEAGTFRFFDVAGNACPMEVPAGSLAFSVCQVPVVYELSPGEAWIRITAADGTSSTRSGDCLDAAHSRAIFGRLGTVRRVDVGVPATSLCRM